MPLTRRSAGLLLGAICLVSLAAGGWSAAAEPDLGREWDEQYPLRNAANILRTGSLKPIFPWYPSLSHLPTAALLAASRTVHRATGLEAAAVFTGVEWPDSAGSYWLGDLSPTAFVLGRWVSVLFGVACLVLTFRLGRRLFSVEVGLLAAALQALAAVQLWAASRIKPDTLLMMLTLVAFLWGLRAVERRGIGPYLLAGAGIGLATAAKQTGVLVAIPLVVATLVGRDRARWLGLVAAGLTSGLVFLALNPFPDLLHRYLSIGREYQYWAAAQTSDPLPTLLFFPAFVVDPLWHGWLVGPAALAALAILWGVVYRRRQQRQEAIHLLMFVSFPLGFLLACAAISSYPKGNVFLPLLPFTALAAAWLLTTVWERATRRLAPARRRRLLAPALLALLAVLAPPWASFLYAEAVPETTLDAAATTIMVEAPFLSQRTVFYEGHGGTLVVKRSWTRDDDAKPTVHRVQVLSLAAEALPRVSESELDLADYEVFPEKRLHGPDRAFYLGRMTRFAGAEAWILDPQPLRRRGRAQVVLAHPWTPQGEALEVPWEPADRERTRWLRGSLPAGLAPGQIVSLDLELTPGQAGACELELARQPLPFIPYHWRDDTRVTARTRRFPLARPEARVELRCDRARRLRSPPVVSVWRWAPTRRPA